MHLPNAKRRRLVYATACVMATSGILFTWQHYIKVGHAQITAAALAPAPEESGQPGNRTAMLQKQPVTAATDTTKETGAAVTPRQKVQTYKVLEGDTVDAIALKFGLKPSTILWSNDMSVDDSLQIDQELQVPAVDGLVYTIQRDDTLWSIANDASVAETTIIQANPDLDPANLQPGQVLLVPDAQPPARRMVASRGSANSGRPSGHKLVNWPATGPLTDSFGWRIHPVYGTHSFHDGMDIGVPSGTPLAAAAAGTVTMTGRNGGYGLIVRIDHGGGIETEYAHMSEIDVSVGDKVGAGARIGLSGNTGVSTGAHLHFMVIVDGTPTDPATWLP